MSESIATNTTGTIDLKDHYLKTHQTVDDIMLRQQLHRIEMKLIRIEIVLNQLLDEQANERQEAVAISMQQDRPWETIKP